MVRRKVVLIISAGPDDHGNAVALELTRRNVPVWRWNLETFPRASSLSIHLDSGTDGAIGGVLKTADGDLPLEDVKSVWLRRSMSALFDPQARPDDIDIFVRLELEAAFRGLADVLRRAFWINPPLALHSMESETTKLRAAVEAGLLVPRTLVTTDAGRARDFSASLDGRVVVKSPCIFQEEIPSEANVRVLIIGRQIFAAESLSAKTEYRPYALPASAAAACQRLLQGWGLVFGAVDMIRRPDGEHLFLAFDANAEWLWLERTARQPITPALADLLEAGRY